MHTDPEKGGLLGVSGPRVLNPKLRAKFLYVMDGRWDQLQVLMFYVNSHTQCERILDWCSTNRVIGHELVNFFKFNGGSVLRTIAEVVRRIERDGVARPIFIGRDIR